MLGAGKIIAGMILILFNINCTEKMEKDLSCYEQLRKTQALPSAYMGLYDKYVRDNADCKNKEHLIVLTGSSTMANWINFREDLPGYNVVNRPFDGCYTWHLTYCLDVIAQQLRPQWLFVYAADNDAVKYLDNEDICSAIQCFVNTLHLMSPETRLVFISIKPSPSREGLFERYRELNQFLKSISEQDASVGFIDIWEPMFGKDGFVNTTFFEKDRLHLSESGYQLLATNILDYLKQHSNK